MSKSTSVLTAAAAAAAPGADPAPATPVAETPEPATPVAAAPTPTAPTPVAAAPATDPAKAERERILGIQQAAFPGQEAMAQEMIADGKTTPGEAALRFNADMKAKGPDHVASLQAMDQHVQVPANPTGGAAVEPSGVEADTPEAWGAKYDKTPALQNEFGSKEAYVAYRQGVADGRIRIKSDANPAAA